MLRKILLYSVFSSVFFINSNAMPSSSMEQEFSSGSARPAPHMVQEFSSRFAKVNILPSIDIAFKNVFGVESNKGVLIHFLNSILQRNKSDRIVDLTFLNTEIPGGIYEKLSRLDVLVLTSNNEKINIEIQVRNAGNISKRSLFYASQIISQSLASGQTYDSLPKIIMINLLGYRAFDDTRGHRTEVIMDRETHEIYNNNLEFHTFELPKYRVNISANEFDVGKAWLAFLTEPNNAFAIGENAPQQMTQARETLLRLESNNGFRNQYEQRDREIRDQNSALAVLEAERKKSEEALADLEAERRRSKEALAALDTERRKNKAAVEEGKREMVRQLKARNLLSIAQIAEITGLTERQIKAIK